MIQNCIPEFLDTGRKCWTLYSGCWTPDAGLWALDSGCWTLDARLSTLDSRRWALYTGHCFTASERWTLFHLPVSEQNQNPVSGSAWLNYWKFFRCESLGTSRSRLFCRCYWFWMAFFRNSILTLSVTLKNNGERNFYCENRITLQAAILDCSEAAIHSHPFSKISPENTGGRVPFLVKLQTDCSE